MNQEDLNKKRDELWPFSLDTDTELQNIDKRIGFNACADILLPEIEYYSRQYADAVSGDCDNRIFKQLMPKITQLEKDNQEMSDHNLKMWADTRNFMLERDAALKENVKLKEAVLAWQNASIDITKKFDLAMKALDTATDLLPVPEHRQEKDWYEKEKEVHETFAKLKVP